MTHTCECGATLETSGWNNNVGTILRCEGCVTHRQSLVAEINTAIQGRAIETVYVSNAVRSLVSPSDFSSVEIIYRRAERMNGEDFHVEVQI